MKWLSKGVPIFLAGLLITGLWSCVRSVGTPQVKPGIDQLMDEQIALVTGKRVGLITNPTGVTSALKSTVDALHEHPDIKLVALYGPEHGVRGDYTAGAHIEESLDSKTGVPVHSLYGKHRKPTQEMLKGVDVLLYDIQDIGCRSYTYIYTMAYAMEAAAEKGIPVIVLDRPNPLGGELVEGPMLNMEYRSFIGLYPIAYIYGMTVGELAELFNIEYNINCDLTVVKMEGWERWMAFEDTGLEWIPTSPHIPRASTAWYYPATGIIGELNTFNIGVGYTLPFELMAAPWIDAELLADELNGRSLPGVYFRPIHYRPYYLHFASELVHGVHLHILDRSVFKPVSTQMHILDAIHTLYPEQEIFSKKRKASLDRAFGSDYLRKATLAGKSAREIIASWQDELSAFRDIREKYLLYR